jgi:hypothetical protein
LNTIIKAAENEMLLMRRNYETALEQLNVTASQLLALNQELTMLHNKSNQQQRVLRNAEMELQSREQVHDRVLEWYSPG